MNMNTQKATPSEAGEFSGQNSLPKRHVKWHICGTSLAQTQSSYFPTKTGLAGQFLCCDEHSLVHTCFVLLLQRKIEEDEEEEEEEEEDKKEVDKNCFADFHIYLSLIVLAPQGYITIF